MDLFIITFLASELLLILVIFGLGYYFGKRIQIHRGRKLMDILRMRGILSVR